MKNESIGKILLVIDGLEFGGGERVFLQLVSRLKGRFKVMVAASPGGKFKKEIKRTGAYFFPVEMNSRFSLKPIRKLKRIIKSEKIDLVHSQGARADYFARVAGRIANVHSNICTIAMPVEGFDVRPLRKKIYRIIDGFTEQYVEKFIVVSDSLKKNLIEKRRIPASKIVRIYNGIELDQYHPDAENGKIRKEWKIPQEAPLIGAIGRMVWQKGFEFLIRAIPEIVQVVPDAKFIFVGDGPLRDKLG
ncbi:glycosyltransferase, partial [Candidatus Pacearchaeota archaeon]|nr:glycosyltransferase [Candidatus Pacearchaeota archaeon]